MTDAAIVIPQGNTLARSVRLAFADGGAFGAGDYAVVKVRDGTGCAVWEGVYDLGAAYDPADGAAVFDWDITGEASACLPYGRYKWDLTVHIGAQLDRRGQPAGAAEVITPGDVRMSDFIVERVASHGGLH